MKSITAVILGSLILSCASKNICKEYSVESQLKEFVGIKLWKEDNPAEYSIASFKAKLGSNQQELIRQKAKVYIDALKLEDAKLVGKDREYMMCNATVNYTDKKFILKYSIEEFDVGKTKHYRVNVIDMLKLAK